MSYFYPPDDNVLQNTTDNKLLLDGRLHLKANIENLYFNVIKDHYSVSRREELKVSILPSIEFSFTVRDLKFIPIERSVQRSSHPYWEWVVQPGDIRPVASGSGVVQVVFPFALQEINANCTHNGVIEVRLTQSGEFIDGVYQVASETCAYFQFDLVGGVQGEYFPKKIANGRTESGIQKVSDDREITNYTASNFSDDYPEIDIKKLIDLNSQAVTLSGIFIGKKNYILSCQTRAGDFPDCNDVSLPSYSTAKTIYAGIGLMILEKQFPNIRLTKVTDVLPECSVKNWQNVTLNDLINMRTGNYSSKQPNADESSKEMVDFFLAETHAVKVKLACEMFTNKSAPGLNFVYHTSDTYLAGVMMQRLFNKFVEEGDFYQKVFVQGLWKKLSLSPLLNESKRTYDQVNQTFTGWGLTYKARDVVEISRFLFRQLNLEKEKQLLSFSLLQSSLQPGIAPASRKTEQDKLAYNNGVWAIEASDFLDCKKERWIPFMSGYGGISVVMISPELIYYNFSDNGEYRWLTALKELSQYFSVCEVL
ncbi:hypothetical protein [Aliikangiella sp. G2MR2-5]|uniref:hypothetical protein n=1 Tax=Aliikangiella sp. G2MR2-5 TaxID=2788943 RepID=UPI0018A96D02|nr:hypothetical protein [Aliikangiella sp. G2MR2-5]